MNIKNIFRVLLLIIVMLSAVQAVPAGAKSPLTVSGWFSIVWGDGAAGSGSAREVYTLATEDGQTIALQFDGAQSVLGWNGQYVTVRGVETASNVMRVESLSVEQMPQKTEAAFGSLVSGSRPFISIMCKFSDVAAEPNNLSYFQSMYGNSYPGLNHYWREISYDVANVAGSNAVGWYTLPQPRSYYVYGGSLDMGRAANDCTAAAEPAVNFSNFVGINMMFNADLDGFAWGGSWYLTLDGVSKVWPVTWEPPWGYSDITVIAHEMGHAFGLPHSSGTYGQTYDNQWDVMSDTWSNCGRSTDAAYGCLGQHTIAYHKDMLGWIPAAQKYTVAWKTFATVTLEQMALPTTSKYRLVQVPIGGSSTHFYTVEARRQTGYDYKLPGQAVIIHEVDTARSRPANVIDADGNFNTGDAGAMWTVGETFTDAANNISITVNSATATGFQVTVQNNHAVTFADVPASHWAYPFVDSLYKSGITGGCATNPSMLYCPSSTVTRAQMAIFLLRGIHGSSYTPPAASGTRFTDVAQASFGAAFIEQLALEGITSGCGGTNYCPNSPVTRSQMAVFLLRAKHGGTYVPPAASGAVFSDVPLGYPTAAWIEQLAAESITGGCGGSNYCPSNSVTRDQMAVFLVKTFGLP